MCVCVCVCICTLNSTVNLHHLQSSGSKSIERGVQLAPATRSNVRNITTCSHSIYYGIGRVELSQWLALSLYMYRRTGFKCMV